MKMCKGITLFGTILLCTTLYSMQETIMQSYAISHEFVLEIDGKQKIFRLISDTVTVPEKDKRGKFYQDFVQDFVYEFFFFGENRLSFYIYYPKKNIPEKISPDALSELFLSNGLTYQIVNNSIPSIWSPSDSWEYIKAVSENVTSYGNLYKTLWEASRIEDKDNEIWKQNMKTLRNVLAYWMLFFEIHWFRNDARQSFFPFTFKLENETFHQLFNDLLSALQTQYGMKFGSLENFDFDAKRFSFDTKENITQALLALRQRALEIKEYGNVLSQKTLQEKRTKTFREKLASAAKIMLPSLLITLLGYAFYKWRMKK